jgi:hypothetical protein
VPEVGSLSGSVDASVTVRMWTTPPRSTSTAFSPGNAPARSRPTTE